MIAFEHELFFAVLSTMSDWSVFLTSVDATAPDHGTLERVEKFFVDKQVQIPADLDGCVATDFAFEEIKEVPARAFARRALRTGLAVIDAKRVASGHQQLAVVSSQQFSGPQPGQNFSQPGLTAAVLEVLGNDASSAAVANMLTHGDKFVPVNDKLKAAGMENLAFHLRPDSPVWQLLNSENESAKIDGRVAFCYVDLTSKAMMPMWLPHDAIGGKALASGSDWALDPYASTSSLGALGAALKAATQTPKFFRSLAQWTAVFTRYAVVAVSMNQLTWDAVMAHLDVVMKISEEAKAVGDSMYLAILYDDLQRKSVADRASKRDPGLDLKTEFTEVNKQVHALAKSRINQVLISVGMHENPSSRGSQPAESDAVAIESVLAKQQAAAEAVTRRAEQAVRQMSKQQEDMERRKVVLQGNGRSFPQDDRGQQHWGNNGQQQGNWGQGNPAKRKDRFAQHKSNKKGKGKGKGKGKW